MNPPAVGAKAVLKPTKAITTSANPVIKIVFNRLKSSSSPSSPISRKPTEIVIVKTSSAAISTQRLLIVCSTFVAFGRAGRNPAHRAHRLGERAPVSPLYPRRASHGAPPPRLLLELL